MNKKIILLVVAQLLAYKSVEGMSQSVEVMSQDTFHEHLQNFDDSRSRLSSLPTDLTNSYILRYLLETVQHRFGGTHMHFAARSRLNKLFLSLLSEKNVQIDSVDDYGQTLLYAAAFSGSNEIVQSLLAAKADVNGASNIGLTPLYAAALCGHTQIVQMLLRVGADVHKATNSGETPLFAAAERGHVEIIQKLVNGGSDIHHTNAYGETSLFAAAFCGKTQIVQILLAAGADVHKAKNNGETPLFAAAERGHADVISILLAAGADVHKPTNSAAQRMADLTDSRGQREIDGSWTPLYAAAFCGKTQIVQMLLEAGADVHAATNKGQTPLFAAAQKGHAEIVKSLLQAGADVHRATDDGRTPLSVATERHAKICQMLQEAADKKHSLLSENGKMYHWHSGFLPMFKWAVFVVGAGSLAWGIQKTHLIERISKFIKHMGSK